MRTLLVTGGAGFIGANFVRLALARTADLVVVLDKLTYAGSLLNLQGLDERRLVFIRGDIAERDTVRRVFAAHRPDAVVNFAAETHVDRSIDDPTPVVATNINGVFELLEAARAQVRAAAGTPAGTGFRFVQVSTDEVYGSLGPEGAFREDTPYAPNSPYAASKAAADHLARAWHHTFELPVMVTNCSNNFGPYQFPEKLIPLMILNALEGRRLPIYGDGLNVRDWLYVEDHCAGILLVLEHGRPGENYNIGGGNERTNIEIVDGLCAALERHAPAAGNEALRRAGIGSYAQLKAFVADRPGHDRRYAIDAGKIRAELGWRPEHDVAAAMDATVRWYVENRAWCTAVLAGKYDRERLGLGPR